MAGPVQGVKVGRSSGVHPSRQGRLILKNSKVGAGGESGSRTIIQSRSDKDLNYGARVEEEGSQTKEIQPGN